MIKYTVLNSSKNKHGDRQFLILDIASGRKAVVTADIIKKSILNDEFSNAIVDKAGHIRVYEKSISKSEQKQINPIIKINALKSGEPLRIKIGSTEWKQCLFIETMEIQGNKVFRFFDNSGLTGMFDFSEKYIYNNTDIIKFEFNKNNPVEVAKLIKAIKER